MSAFKQINYGKLMAKKPVFFGQIINQALQTVKFYEDPIYGDEASVIGVINQTAFRTGFYDTDDFKRDSDYNPILLADGTVVCAFETIY